MRPLDPEAHLSAGGSGGVACVQTLFILSSLQEDPGDPWKGGLICFSALVTILSRVWWVGISWESHKEKK